MKIHHTGILTNNLKAAIAYYNKYYYLQISEEILRNTQKVKIIFLKKKNKKRLIELIQYNNDNKKLKDFFLKGVPKNKLFFKYHDCYFLNKNYQKKINEFINHADYKLITQSKTAIFEKVSFFKKNKRKNLIEIVSQPKIKFNYLVK